MRTVDATADDADARAANALLVLLNAVGIPVLVRTFGETHVPPSATLGVLGALFHASVKPSSHTNNSSSSSSSSTTDDSSTLRDAATAALHALVTSQRVVTYHAAPHELLMVLAGDAPLAGAGSPRVLRCLSAALALLLGGQQLEMMDAARQRLALSHHAETLDRVVRSSRRDIRVLLGRPLRALRSDQRALQSLAAATTIQQCIWLRDGAVVAEYVARGCRLRLDAIEIVSGGGAIARVAIEAPTTGGTSCVGIFSEAATDNELQETMPRMVTAFSEADSSETASSLPRDVLGKLPPAAIEFLNPNWRAVCAEVAQVGGEPPKATNAVSGTSARALASVEEDAIWSALCSFVATRLDESPSGSLLASRVQLPRSSDYKREDELFTILHHSRGQLQFFSLYASSLSLQETTMVGDVLYEFFSDYNE
ncbi:hypothetical protein PybrP1_011461 [[Pythium] brassicae (nom. inval.)]|nr:hypothetical protein PybrP1_011461 [[Pythium] brassicae (nom. inval.)]